MSCDYQTAKALDGTQSLGHDALTAGMEEMEIPKYLVYGKAWPIVCKNLTAATKCAIRLSIRPTNANSIFRVFCTARGEWMCAYRQGMEVSNQSKK